MYICVNFEDKILFSGGERENPDKFENFQETINCHTTQVENMEVFYISDDETRNLVAWANFVEFRDSQNFTFFEAKGVD